MSDRTREANKAVMAGIIGAFITMIFWNATSYAAFFRNAASRDELAAATSSVRSEIRQEVEKREGGERRILDVLMEINSGVAELRAKIK